MKKIKSYDALNGWIFHQEFIEIAKAKIISQEELEHSFKVIENNIGNLSFIFYLKDNFISQQGGGYISIFSKDTKRIKGFLNRLNIKKDYFPIIRPFNPDTL